MFYQTCMILWMLQILVAIVSVDCRTSHFLGLSVKAWIPPRGGDDKLGGDRTSTVHSVAAVLQWGNDANAPFWLVGNNSTMYSALLLGSQNANPIFRIPQLPQDDNLVQSLGLLSDVIILWLPSDSNLHDLKNLSQTLSDMAQERMTRQISTRPRLVVVSDSANDSWWVQDLVQNQLPSILPSFWESFDILTPRQFENQWKNGDSVQQDGIIKSFLLPFDDNAPAASQLLKQLYTSRTETSLHEKDGWFELQSAPTESKIEPSLVADDSSHSSDNQEDPQSRIERILGRAQQDLATLEAKLQQVQLETTSSNAMPLLDFGQQANAILEHTYRELDSFPNTVRVTLVSRLVLQVHQLYKDQLQALRDYYGRRYETVLDQQEKADEAVWAKEAEHLTQGFQAAAQHALPLVCQKDGPLATIVTFDAIPTLQGLIQDMLEATQLRKDEHSLAFDEDDDNDEDLLSQKKPRVPRWVKKLASRAITLGINYLQGWLAWQGVKKAALERDREMPKFPLF